MRRANLVHSGDSLRSHPQALVLGHQKVLFRMFQHPLQGSDCFSRGEIYI